jgi:hypothetical protein
MPEMSDSGKRTKHRYTPVRSGPDRRRPTISPGWGLARRWTQLASPAIVALVAYLVRRLS